MQPDSTERPGATAAETNALLQRILVAVETDRRRGRLELAIAIILSLSTLATTWCGYQARLWGSAQGIRQAEADTAERQAMEDTIVGFQLRTFDGITMIEYWSAVRNNDEETREAIEARMRPQLRQAIEGSIAAGALHDPRVAGPLQRPEYVLVEEEAARGLRAEAGRLKADAQQAGRRAGAYVLLTLMFASVLFFGGIAGTFTARRVRVGLACVALALFAVTMVNLIGLPVYRG